MITREANEFFSRMQHYVFVRDEVEINPQTQLPDKLTDWTILDVDDLVCVGTPLDADDGEMVLWGIVNDPEEAMRLKEMQLSGIG